MVRCSRKTCLSMQHGVKLFLEESAFDLPRIFLLLKCSYPMLLTFLGCLYTWPCTVGLERGGKAMSFLHKVCMVCGK